MKHTLFISDLHLAKPNPLATQLFLAFLQNTAPQADALYILGDLFDLWLGDDLCTDYEHQIATALAQLSMQIPIYFMHGNHDFLIQSGFLSRSRMQLLADPSRISLYGTETLLKHGDDLCSNDKSHQRYRKIVFHPLTRRCFLMLPKAWRQKIAKGIQNSSRQRNALNDRKNIAISPLAVTNTLQQHNTWQLIHGHTHQPLVEITEGVHPAKRIVLGAWRDTAHSLIYRADGSHSFITE